MNHDNAAEILVVTGLYNIIGAHHGSISTKQTLTDWENILLSEYIGNYGHCKKRWNVSIPRRHQLRPPQNVLQHISVSITDGRDPHNLSKITQKT